MIGINPALFNDNYRASRWNVRGSVEDVVTELHVSRRTLEVHLKRMTGQTPQTAIFRAQINKAKKMLVETGDKIWKIAHECGFDSEPRFFIVFKRETGMTPSQYRQQN